MIQSYTWGGVGRELGNRFWSSPLPGRCKSYKNRYIDLPTTTSITSVVLTPQFSFPCFPSLHCFYLGLYLALEFQYRWWWVFRDSCDHALVSNARFPYSILLVTCSLQLTLKTVLSILTSIDSCFSRSQRPGLTSIQEYRFNCCCEYSLSLNFLSRIIDFHLTRILLHSLQAAAFGVLISFSEFCIHALKYLIWHSHWEIETNFTQSGKMVVGWTMVNILVLEMVIHLLNMKLYSKNFEKSMWLRDQ